MGILDDAIREHLDLKRRLGAEEDELKRLEGEAFGPPSRPGDPDFPAQGEQPGGEPVTGEEVAAATEPPPIAEPPSEELAATAAPTDTELEPPPTAEEPAAPPIDEAPAAGLYDRTGDELDLELDVDLDQPAPLADTGESATIDEPAPPPPPAPEPPATDEQAAVEPPPQPPIESLDTVEHHFEEAIEDTGEAELVEGELAEEPESADGEEDEDVLEETPEFLRDAPEDDELWFEQGEPKDFDF